MKHFYKAVQFATLAIISTVTFSSVAKADWEFVNMGIICVSGTDSSQVEQELNNRLFADSSSVAFAVGRGHKKVRAPFRIINVSMSFDRGYGYTRTCAAIESINP